MKLKQNFDKKGAKYSISIQNYYMQSFTINQLVTGGLTSLAYASQYVLNHIADTNIVENASINGKTKLSMHKFPSYLFKFDVSIPFNELSQQILSSDRMIHAILTYASFLNKDMMILLRVALTSDSASFRHALHDFKMTHKRKFADEINQWDNHQNTLLWYLAVAEHYDSIEELHRLALVDLNISAKNGPFSQSILHYAAIHGNVQEIRVILDIGIDPNLYDRFGRTALHYVALYGTKYKNDVEVAKLLLNYGTLPKYESCELTINTYEMKTS